MITLHQVKPMRLQSPQFYSQWHTPEKLDQWKKETGEMSLR